MVDPSGDAEEVAGEGWAGSEEVQVGLTSAVAGGQSHPARPVELAKAISEGLGHAGLVAVPPTELNIFPSQEKIAASASKGRKLKK